MMAELSGYLLSIVGGAMVVGVLGCFPVGESGKKLLRLVSGLFLTLLLLRPVVQFDWRQLRTLDFLEQGELAAAYGTELSDRSRQTIIKDRTEAYILDKAAAYEARLEAEVSLDNSGVPESVILRGSISPYGKRRLGDIIAEDLGISKENQIWMN